LPNNRNFTVCVSLFHKIRRFISRTFFGITKKVGGKFSGEGVFYLVVSLMMLSG
jgi:hypothetical protein